jgi:MTH538 TIR-like domain (DUF1863)
MSYLTSQQRVYAAAQAALRRSTDPTRRKCFVSYHAADSNEVVTFINNFGAVFIPKVLGVTVSDPFVNSTNTDYIMEQIREEYLTDSTVTIVLVGRCTWSRKFIDWEIYSSLRNDRLNRRNGLLAIKLSSLVDDPILPARLDDNIIRDASNNELGYARYYVYPVLRATLQAWIEDAYTARSNRASAINNTRARRLRDSLCL